MAEEAIIRKLIADGDGTGDDRRIVQLFQLITMLNKANSDTKSITHKILTNLDLIELSFQKQSQISAVTEEEIVNYERLCTEIDQMITQNSDKMEAVKKELAEAKQIRKNRQEYDALAKLIKEKPSRADTSRKLKGLQDELEEAYAKQKILEQRLIEKRKNMYTLAVLLDNLDEMNKETEDVPISEGEDASAIPTVLSKSTGPEKPSVE
uniref:THO complex subunit 7 n=1 Tax=Globodera rostochiensis TaxID=31243 RepID=A0A914H184_GLORO